MPEKGGQPGNNNAGKNKPITDAIRRALLAEDGAKARRLADALVEKAIAGDVPAVREVLDRMEGKVPQGIEGPGKDGAIILKIESGDAEA